MNIGGVGGYDSYRLQMEREIKALDAAPVSREKKTRAIEAIKSGQAGAADEALLMAEKPLFRDVLAGMMKGNA